MPKASQGCPAQTETAKPDRPGFELNWAAAAGKMGTHPPHGDSARLAAAAPAAATRPQARHPAKAAVTRRACTRPAPRVPAGGTARRRGAAGLAAHAAVEEGATPANPDRPSSGRDL